MKRGVMQNKTYYIYRKNYIEKVVYILAYV